eukprot:g294.t1
MVRGAQERQEGKGSSLYSWKGALAAAGVGAAAVAEAYFYRTKDEPREKKKKKKKRRNNGKKKNKKKEKKIKMVKHDAKKAEKREAVSDNGSAQFKQEREEQLIGNFIAASRQMLALEMKGAGPQALDSLQTQRQAIVTELYAVGGDAAVQKLKAGLAQMEKEAPPPDPSELLFKSQLAMKIMNDPDFNLKSRDETMSAMEKEVQKTVKAAYWDSIRYRIGEGNTEDLVRLIRDLRGALLGVLEAMPKARAIAADLEKIDLDFISQQLKAGAFSSSDFTAVLRAFHGVFNKLQSAARDASTNAWLEESLALINSEATLADAIEPIFSGAFDIVEQIQLDLLNYQISVMKPVLRERGAEWQRSAFDERLEKNEVSLERTFEIVQAVVSAETDAGTLSREELGRGESFQPLWRVALMHVIFEIAQLPKNVSGEDAAHLIPEVLEAAAPEVLDVAKTLREIIESLYIVLKAKFFFQTHNISPALSSEELQEIYAFSMQLASAPVEDKVEDVEVEGKTMKVIARIDAHGEKGRRGRLESMAAFVASVYSNRSDTTLEKQGKFNYDELLAYFMQLADSNDTIDPVIKGIVALAKKKLFAFTRGAEFHEVAKYALMKAFASRGMACAVPDLAKVTSISRNIACRTEKIYALHISEAIRKALVVHE